MERPPVSESTRGDIWAMRGRKNSVRACQRRPRQHAGAKRVRIGFVCLCPDTRLAIALKGRYRLSQAWERSRRVCFTATERDMK